MVPSEIKNLLLLHDNFRTLFHPLTVIVTLSLQNYIMGYFVGWGGMGVIIELGLTNLFDIFMQINSQKKKTGVIAPKRFVQRLRKENDVFRGYMHQVCTYEFGSS